MSKRKTANTTGMNRNIKETKMRKFSLYKHENSTDLVIEPTKIFELPDRIKIKANLYTTGYPGKRILMDTARWEITKEEYKNWRPYE